MTLHIIHDNVQYMSAKFNRILKINLPESKSAFLWGPRKVGKSFWIRENFSDAIIIDFLKTDVFADYISRPYLLRERFSDTDKLIVIDEVQMVPQILNEVHWLIENKQISFLLTGSSPRKLRASHANLLGGRAWRFVMAPLCFPEIEKLDIDHAVISGLIPSHYLSDDPILELRSYVGDYLKEEIVSWAVTHNIQGFAEFLRVAALTNGEILNYNNVAREAGIDAKTVRQYFQILEDTLLGFRLQPWKRKANRRLIETEKFYLFDMGVANYLARRRPGRGTPEYGKSFEHYILMELKAYQAYKNPELPIYYWRTTTGLEVDFILGDMEVAVEIKSSDKIYKTDAKGLKALDAEYSLKRKILVSFETGIRNLESGIESMHYNDFLSLLWNGEL